MTESTVVVPALFFGRIECETRFRLEGDCLIGEGRASHYDREGFLLKQGEWQPTGVRMTWA